MNEPVDYSRLLEVRQKLDTQAQELATLAARICPGICQKDPSRAIEIAKALRAEARREISKSGGGKELWKVLCEITAEQGRKEAQARGEQFDERLHEELASAYDMDLVDNLPRKLVEYLDPIYKKYRSFESGVKYITGEKRLDRAMPWFRKFIKSRTPNDLLNCADSRPDTMRSPLSTQLFSRRGFVGIASDLRSAIFARCARISS